MAMQENEIIELIGEDGAAESFEHLMTLEYDKNYYIVLAPAEAEDENEAGEVVIMRIDKDEHGVDCYVVVEDEQTMQAVFDQFIELIEEEDDAIPSDTGDDEDDDE